MSNLDKNIEERKRDTRSAKERAAERWGMKDEKQKEAAPEKPLEKSQGKRDFKAELAAWGERPRHDEPRARSDIHETGEREPDE